MFISVPAVEAISSEREDEITLYARIGNRDGLAKATQVIEQEQAQLKTPKGGVRVRKFREGRNWAYEMTTKTKLSDTGSVVNQEQTTEITSDVYRLFLSACQTKMVKSRFVFPIERCTVKNATLNAEVVLEGLKWEVDVFQTPEGLMSEWCKIDLEITTLRKQLKAAGLKVKDLKLALKVTGLPIDPLAYFYDDGAKSGDMRELVSTIYATQFLIPVNPNREVEEPVPV